MRRFFHRTRQARALRRLLRRVRAASDLTLDEYERVVTLVGGNPDRCLQNGDELKRLLSTTMPPERLGQLLDIVAPGHGVEVGALSVRDAEHVGGAVLAVFTFASAVNSSAHTTRSSR